MNNTMDFRDMDLCFDEVYLDDEIEDDNENAELEEDTLFEIDKNGESRWKELSYYKYNQGILSR